MTSLPRSWSRPARWAASTSALACSASAPATAATWLACTWSSPRETPPVPGASSKKRQTAASMARRPTLTRPTRFTAWRTVWARMGRAQAAELAKRRMLAASPGSESSAATSSLVSDSGSEASSRTRRTARSSTGSCPMRAMASCRSASAPGECRCGACIRGRIFGRELRELRSQPRERARLPLVARLSPPVAQRYLALAGLGALPLFGLWAEPRLVSLTLGVTIKVPYVPVSRTDVCDDPPPTRAFTRMKRTSPDRRSAVSRWRRARPPAPCARPRA